MQKSCHILFLKFFKQIKALWNQTIKTKMHGWALVTFDCRYYFPLPMRVPFCYLLIQYRYPVLEKKDY